eukprot:CAMPEP_0119321842 /NCGR_PEP_ID=MMETSP1333-20130426/56600_1 /TAXON_ID=418940 /ORGANISM="Scyphosphaera apsteinii, Strain RCC1455" /LENGTH=45 /DNA_ID= /DNA_START= /DNA_END= /DNA_ORIENTATION=
MKCALVECPVTINVVPADAATRLWLVALFQPRKGGVTPHRAARQV